MEDKSSNILIVLILIIVIGLGGLYVYKVMNNKGYTAFMKEDENQIEIVNAPKTNHTNTQNTNVSNQSSSIVIPSVETNNSEGKTAVTTSSNVNTTYAYNNRYYYNQLDNYSKVIYDAIVNNIGNLKYGNYTISIDYDFAQLLSQNGGSDKLGSYYDDAVNAINLDVPNLFYIDFSKMSLNIEQTTSLFNTKYRLYINSGENPNYFSSSFSSSTQVENAINTVEGLKNNATRIATGSEYNRVKQVHDWLIEYLSYDSSSTNRGTIYGALYEKKAVCEGYARTYKYILDELRYN